MSLLEKIKHFLKPKTIEELSSLNQEVAQKFVVQLAKLTRLIESYTRKEAALDKLLKDWGKTNLNELLGIMDDFEQEISSEWGSLEEFKESLSNLSSSKDKNKNDALEQLKYYLFELGHIYSNQLKIISSKEKLLEDKLSITKFCESLTSEKWYLELIFNFETKHFEDLDKVSAFEVSKIARLFNSPDSQKNALRHFIARCINFVKTNGIKSVLVTDDSARILGMILLDQFKLNNLKIPVFGFNPRIIQAPQTYKKNATAQDLFDSIVTERRAMVKTIIGNAILIIDEFGSSGGTLIDSKKFFERLGAKKVYTALFSGTWGDYKFTPDILPGPTEIPDWAQKPSCGRNKYADLSKGILRTRTNILSSKYKVMNDFHQQLLRDYKEFMKKIARGEIK